MKAVQEIIDAYPTLWALFSELPARSDSALKDAFSDIIQQYSQDHRHYHTAAHLEHLTQEFETHRALFGADKDAIIAALFYHDIIYNCEPSQDETQSAAYAQRGLQTLGVDQSIIDRAVGIIVATSDHRATEGDAPAQLFLDMDMSILAAPEKRYDEYVEQVTQEFCGTLNITPAFYKAARAERFLVPTLARGDIFITPQYKPLEEQAISNMRRELEHP